jgi:hypothetical protein
VLVVGEVRALVGPHREESLLAGSRNWWRGNCGGSSVSRSHRALKIDATDSG